MIKKHIRFMIVFSFLFPLNVYGMEGFPLHEAIKQGNIQEVKRLCDAGVDPNEKNGYLNTPLHIAAWFKNEEVIERLCDAGASLNEKNKDGNTPLHLTAFCRNEQITIILCSAGANLNEKNNYGSAPIHIAANLSNQGIFALILLFSGKNALNRKTNDGKTVFDVAKGEVRELLSDEKKLNAAIGEQRKRLIAESFPGQKIYTFLRKREIGAHNNHTLPF